MDARQMLVDVIRMLERAEVIDHSGHCSIRRDGATFYINSGASVRSTLSVADIVVVNLDGVLLDGTAKPPLEFHLHSEIYRARADVHAIVHAHPRWSTVLTMTDTPLKTVYAQAALLGDVTVFDSPLSINSKAMGERVAATLGRGRAVLLKSHGAVIVAADMIECFALTTYLEENARRQYLAMQIGEPYGFSDEEQQVCRANLSSPSLFKKSWDYFFSKLSL